MPGICGAVGAVRSSDLGTTLAEMMARMKHHPWYVENAYCNNTANVALGRVSLGFVNKGDQPASNEDGSLLEGIGHAFEINRSGRQTRGGPRARDRCRWRSPSADSRSRPAPP